MPIPVDHTRPVRVSAKESAHLQLQQWIIDGTLQPGEKLVDTELAEALNLSRTPIREALQLLEVQGFIEMFPGKATRVTDIHIEDIKHLLPPLAVLQALAGELAIPNLTPEIFGLLEETNRKFARAIRSSDSFSALKIDEEFHQIIVDAAGNPYIDSILGQLQSHVRRQFFHHSLVLTMRSHDEHIEIIETLKACDGDKISHLMKSNWVRTIEELTASKGI
ncbi:GntR family transcriptional regulator [Planococcus maritimus]|uniref:GntR family transcriptional regulator n=1 Tax=Planococcus maritimus TaxID=192421 RepID=UPI00084C95EF|nr:GntR family transcriptional regulator [Planococcus maritimus]OED31579.1 GntR family transcriptional regulator [Planococcus maritimus]